MSNHDMNVYLVYPKNHTDRTVITVAPNTDEAERKAKTHTVISDLTDVGAKLVVIDIDNTIRLTGYKLHVEPIGMYH